MTHLSSDLEYFKFIHNMAPNLWFIHNIDATKNKIECLFTLGNILQSSLPR